MGFTTAAEYSSSMHLLVLDLVLKKKLSIDLFSVVNEISAALPTAWKVARISERMSSNHEVC